MTDEQTPDNTAIVVAQKLATDVVSNETFLELLQKAASYENQLVNLNITDKASFDNAIVSFDVVKTDLTTAEEMRKASVKFPNAYVKAVNGTFKQLKQTLMSVKNRLGGAIQGERTRQADVHKAEVAEAGAQEGEGEQQMELPTNTGEGVQVVETGTPPVSEAPSNVSKTETGVQVHGRKVLRIEVEDVLKLAKAVISKAANNEEFEADLLLPNEGAIRKVLQGFKEDGRKKKVPGVKHWYDDTLV